MGEIVVCGCRFACFMRGFAIFSKNYFFSLY